MCLLEVCARVVLWRKLIARQFIYKRFETDDALITGIIPEKSVVNYLLNERAIVSWTINFSALTFSTAY